MKKILALILLCVGCKSVNAEPPMREPSHEVNIEPRRMLNVGPQSPCPPLPKEKCSDKLILMGENELKNQFSCHPGSRMNFPSYYQSGKILVLCQCVSHE